MPRYRQKVAFLPMNVDTPVWVDDDGFDMAFHVKRAALPGKGSKNQLCDYVERVFSRPLDRRHPLWELYYIENIEGGKWALLTKTHHAMVDGLSALELATVLMDTSDEYVPPAERSKWRSAKNDPGTLGLLMQSLRERAAQPVGLVRGAVEGRPKRGVGRRYLQCIDDGAIMSRDHVQQGLEQMGMSPKKAAVYIEMFTAINAGVLAAQELRSRENTTPTSFENFVQEVFAPAYHGKARNSQVSHT